MDFLNLAIFEILTQLHNLTGSYGWAIILMTVLVRVLLWPLNTAQTRSMKVMQEMQPKMKALQEKYKDNPQKLQEAMMKFYTENKFNPFAGCLPLLIQLPIFFSLYGCLNSPQFLAASGNESFLFINKLYNTLHSVPGQPMDGTIVLAKDTRAEDFTTDKTAKVIFKDPTKEPLTINIPDVHKALIIHPTPLIPNEPVAFEMDFKTLGLSTDYNDLAQSVEVSVINTKSRELEALNLTPSNSVLRQQIKTSLAEPVLHWDVFGLIVAYSILMLLYQQVMQKMNPSSGQMEGINAQMMKFMPLMFGVMMFFIPIPAGVMIYLVVTTLLMFVQTWWVNAAEDKKKQATDGTTKPSDRVIEIKPEQA